MSSSQPDNLTDRHSHPDAAVAGEILLDARALTRWEGTRCIADGISISLRRGEVLGFLGLNGAGKTTTLNMLAGVLTPSSGDVTLGGYTLHGSSRQSRKAKQHLGYLPEIPPLYPDMRVDSYLDYCGKLADAREAAKADCDLDSVGKRVIRNLSKGYRQRIGIAQALIHRPDVILLDEPSSGLDPQQMIAMRELIARLARHHGIVFSTHLLSEATEVCDRICVIHEGRVIHQQDLHNSTTGRQTDNNAIVSVTLQLAGTLSESTPTNETELLNLPGVIAAEIAAEKTAGQHWHLDVLASRREQLLPEILQRGWKVLEYGPRRDTLETLFTALVSGNTSNDDPESAEATRAEDTVDAGSVTNLPAPNLTNQLNQTSDTRSELATDDAATVVLEKDNHAEQGNLTTAKHSETSES